jgi:hypothetical protein
MSYELIPLDLDEANELVRRWHRHHAPVLRHKFAIGLALGDEVVGVGIVGRPVARWLDDGVTLEVTRVAVPEGHRNACSKLYGACRRATFALGYKRLVSYTLASESGSSLKAAGYRLVGEVRGRSWNCPSRPRVDKHPLQDKLRWEACVDTPFLPLACSQDASVDLASVTATPKRL